MPQLNSATGQKICSSSKCRKELPLTAFSVNKSTFDGLSSTCRECNREYREQNKERITSHRKEYNRANKKKSMVVGARQRARARGVPCTITEDDIHIPDVCPIPSCKRLLQTSENNPTASSPSLDSYDPLLGYVPGNIWVICLGCNKRKQDISGEEHVALGWELIEAFKVHNEEEIK